MNPVIRLNLAFFLLLPVLSFAGGNGVGNGGGALYCPDTGSVEFYDLFEGNYRYRIAIEDPFTGTVEQRVRAALAKLANNNFTFALEADVYYDHLLKDRIRMDRVVDPADVDDVKEKDEEIIVLKQGCEYRQLGNWDSLTESLFVNPDLFDKLSIRDQAAFYVHEVLYRAARARLGDKIRNSTMVRRTVAELFSTATQYYLPGSHDYREIPYRPLFLTTDLMGDQSRIPGLWLGKQSYISGFPYSAVFAFDESFARDFPMHFPTVEIKAESLDQLQTVQFVGNSKRCELFDNHGAAVQEVSIWPSECASVRIETKPNPKAPAPTDPNAKGKFKLTVTVVGLNSDEKHVIVWDKAITVPVDVVMTYFFEKPSGTPAEARKWTELRNDSKSVELLSSTVNRAPK